MSKFEEYQASPLVAYLCVTGATLLWAASTVVGRGVHAELPPFGMSFWRWVVAAVVLFPLAWPTLRQKWGLIRAHWKLLTLMGILQVWSSAMLFLGVNFTTAVNATLLNAAQPALTAIPAWLLTRDKVTAGQSVGIAAALAGIVVMVGRGDLAVISSLRFNIGDIYALVAILGWALYATLLHRLPREIGFWNIMFMIFLLGSVTLLPLYVIESLFFRVVPVTGANIGIIAFLGIVTSVGSITLWNTAVRAVGPNRATIFLNLVPVFGVALAIVFLGERLFGYHFAGAALVAAGIALVIARARKKTN